VYFDIKKKKKKKKNFFLKFFFFNFKKKKKKKKPSGSCIIGTEACQLSKVPVKKTFFPPNFQLFLIKKYIKNKKNNII